LKQLSNKTIWPLFKLQSMIEVISFSTFWCDLYPFNDQFSNNPALYLECQSYWGKSKLQKFTISSWSSISSNDHLQKWLLTYIVHLLNNKNFKKDPLIYRLK
jgi:hypothetical protein